MTSTHDDDCSAKANSVVTDSARIKPLIQFSGLVGQGVDIADEAIAIPFIKAARDGQWPAHGYR